MSMTVERAMEILDPEHREHYESIDPVNEACRMGREALAKLVPQRPQQAGNVLVRAGHGVACPTCGSGEWMHNEDGNRAAFCGQCGQAIDWSVV